MLKLLFAIFICWPSYSGKMSDLDLMVREAISEHLDISWDEIHSIHFTEGAEGCLFVLGARAANQSCRVCFVGDISDHWPSEVSCQP
jgi:hypothetical protein